MAYFSDNMPEFLLIAGLAILVIEILVLGFSTFFLFFFGLGLISTGLIFFTGVIDSTYTNALISVAIISSLSAVVLWQPLKKLQTSESRKPVKNDLIGLRFQLDEPLAEKCSIDHQYSGINWKISSDEVFVAGDQVEVVEVGVGKMKVKGIVD